MTETPWHSLEKEEVFRLQESSPEKGLSPEEAALRLERHGPNRLPPPPRRSPWSRFLHQFRNLLIYVLLSAAVITALLSDWVDALVILGVVLINAVIGFIQEGKAEKAVEAIRGILTLDAQVLRGGERMTVPAEHLVPGDVVLLQSGDKIPADLRLFRVKDLRVEEAALTGESVPVEKSVGPVPADAPLGDRSGMAFSGTLVTYGQGAGVVVATAEKTELGKVSSLLAQVQPLATRLTQQMGEFSQWLTGAILILAVGTLLFGILVRDYTFEEIFFASVALAVAAIPEGLPAIITITLAIGVQRMARRQAIIRRLPAVETLGAVTVICSDKTGTLTRNEMTVKTVVTAGGIYEVEGSGYEPRGGFQREGEPVEPSAASELSELARAALLCNDGALKQKGGLWQVEGDPTDGALIALAMKAGYDPGQENRNTPRTDNIPFESEHKFMATLHHDKEGHGFVYLKGAPERVLEMCSHQRTRGVDQPLNPDFWREQIERIAGGGQRTLAVAFRPAGESRQIGFEDVSEGLTLLGFLGLIDPPRPEAIEAVAQCRSAGIRVKMITGDHALTATAIGAQMGLGTEHPAVTGQQIESMEEDELQFHAQRADIFARVSPEHKLRLVQALQGTGGVVAMTGDGVNDAPALKRADVGIAMGRKGTEAAKEAAEMVLADDNFASIAHAVEEGRTVYDNIKKALGFILPTNGAQAGIIIVSVVAGMALPITPLQILWINMVTAVTLALSLAFEPPEEQAMQRPPRDPSEALLTPFLIWRIAFISVIMVMGTLGLFLWDRFHGETLEMARTTAVNTLIFFQIFYLFNARYFRTSALSRQALLGNPFVLVAAGAVVVVQLFFTYFPPFQNLFGTAAIPVMDWVRLLVFTASVFALVEIEKAIFRRIEKNRHLAEALGLR